MTHSLFPCARTSARGLAVSVALLAAASVAQAQAVVGSAEAGATKANMCIGCHGIVGYQNSFPEIHKVPKISGQSANYIASALAAYKKGDRKHPTMRGVGGSLTPQDMADLGAYYAGQAGEAVADAPSKAADVDTAKLIEKGACTSCHGVNFSKPIDPTYPKLAGQHADYLYVALKAYTVQGNAVVGRNNAIMGGIAKQFSHDEMRAMTKYLSSLDSELKIVPQSRFR